MMKKFLSSNSIKNLFLTTLLTLLLTSMLIPNSLFGHDTVLASTPYTWNNTIPEKTPLPANDNGKLVLFDTSHGGTEGSADWVIDGAFSSFADALVAEGYTVREYRGVDKNNDGAIRFYDDRQASNVALNECVITYDAIQDADVFVMAEPNRPLKSSEYDALMQFVNAGKGIYFIADHYNADRNLNTWDSTEVFNGYNRSADSAYNMGGEYGDLRNPGQAHLGWLAQNFGIRFRFNAIDCKSGVSDVRPSTETEGITQGVQPILMAGGATLAIVDGSKAKGLVYLSSTDNASKWSYAADQGLYFGGSAEGPYVAISKPSSGKAAFIGDSSPVEDDTPKYLRQSDGTTKKTWPGWNDTGHAATLSVNIVNWLANSESYVGFDGVNHPAGTVTPNPMIDIEKSEQQAEPWSNPSGGYDPWNTDTFAAGSFGAPNPSGGTTPSTGAQFALYPAYVYANEPFALAITGDSAPKFGAYLDGGSQQGQLLINGSWTGSGYNDVPTPLPTAVTARIVNVDAPPVKIRLKVGSSNKDTKTVTGLSSGYGYLEGTLSDHTGHILVASKNSTILGTALIDNAGHVKVAVKSDSGITLAVYDESGSLVNDLTGSYDVTDGNTTTIAGNSSTMTVAAALAEANGTEVTLTGYIVSELNGQYAVKVADTNSASGETIAVKLEASMRAEFSPVNNPSALGRKILVTGIRNDYMYLPGLRNVSSIEFTDANPPSQNPLAVTTALGKPNGTICSLTGYIVSELNGQYAVRVSDTNDPNAETIAVKLESSMRPEFSPVNNPDALGKKILVTGKRNNYMNLPGLREVSSIEFVDTAMTVAQAKAESNGTEVTLTGYIVSGLNGIYAIKVADTNDPNADFIAVKLESSMRDTFSPVKNPSALGKKILVTGKRNDYMNLPGLKYVTSIEFAN